ncbi:MAG: AarF/ABC1/UbiB kinase family protein [Candidatus Nanopelagicales bacterium]
MALETRRWVRTLRIAAVPARSVGRLAVGQAGRLRGEDPGEVRRRVRQANADDLRTVLGDLKGGALKLGQFLSTVDSLFPPDPEATWQDALTQLQEANPGLPFDDVEPVLRAELGPDWRSRFRGFDERPAAAASLGQVHRAQWVDGRPVAVKIQYPGVRESVAADLRTLGASLRLASVVARGLVVPPVMHELSTRLGEELDYRREAAHQRVFAAAYRDDPGTAVPDVVDATERVLVMDWLPGRPLVDTAGDTDDARARTGLAYQVFLLEAPARTGLLHADPHPGNFRVLDDGRLGVLDFGAVVPMPGGLPPSFGRLVSAFAYERGAALESSLRDAGLVRPGRRLDTESLAEVMSPFSEPARHEVFTYSPEWLRSCFDRNAQARDPDYTVALGLTLPPDQLMTQRVWLGCVGTLCRLGVTVPVRPVLRRYLPGFTEPGGPPDGPPDGAGISSPG